MLMALHKCTFNTTKSQMVAERKLKTRRTVPINLKNDRSLLSLELLDTGKFLTGHWETWQSCVNISSAQLKYCTFHLEDE